MIKAAENTIMNEIDRKAEKLKKDILNYPDRIKGTGKVYYISNSGNDANTGTAPDKAFKTPDALENCGLKPGDEVFFERGGLWRGGFKAHDGVRYAAYGVGDKPMFYGSPFDGAKDGYWEEVSPTVYRYSEKMPIDCGLIVLNHGLHTIKTVLNYTKDVPYENVSGKQFRSYRDLTDDLHFWHDLGGPDFKIPEGRDDLGYIYLCSYHGSPEKRFSSIEFLPRKNVIQIAGNNIEIENLCIKYGGAHGIGSGTTAGLHVRGCELGWIGGGIQFYRNGNPVRFGNGIEIYGGCIDYRIENCYLYQIYDAGITHQISSGGIENILMDGVLYRENLIEYCTYSIEYFCGSAPDTDRKMKNIYMKDNILRFAGYGFGHQRPDKEQAAHIKGWDHYNRLDGDFIIENNIMDRSRYMMIHSGTSDNSWNPVYRQNTFIQNETGQFGRHGKHPTALMMYTKETVFAEEFKNNEYYIR